MNNLEFNVINFKDEKYSHGVVGVDMHIDGKKVNAFLDVAAIVAYAKIEEQTPDALRNNKNFGAKQFFAFTCSCGNPGCAGFFDPVVQRHDSVNASEVVVWSIPPNKTTSLEGDYYFPAQKFYSAIENLKTKLSNLEQEGFYYESFFDVCDKKLYTTLDDAIGRYYSVYNDAMLFSQLATNYIQPEYLDKKIQLTVAGQPKGIELSTEEFLFSILSHYLKDKSSADNMLTLIEQIKFANVVFSAIAENKMQFVWEFIFEGYFYGDYEESDFDELKKDYAMTYGVYLKDEESLEVSLVLS